MFLKSLSLKGFKSFADPAVLEFEPGVTVVVGPNGSGKSNVVDAVAWVLGAQGPRTVRSAKMEDVIFMGTANRPALGRAEVSLTIDNTSGKLSADLAEVTITRTLFRSGDSEYSINGAPCRLLDIQELLSDTGVGRQQHVIISQGHLDAILEARPEDRRSVIEEAAGVLKFRRRRERAERRLASTEENLERLFDLVREVKRQIRPLERQAAAARSYTGLAEELRAVRLYVAGSELAALDERHDQGQRHQVEQRASEAELTEALGALDADSVRTADELSAERESDLTAALGRTEGMVERARGLSGVLRERQRSLARALDAAADADVVSTLEAEGARLAEELAGAEQEGTALAPEQEGPAAAEAALGAELEAHMTARGDGSELRSAEEAVTVARGQLASLEHALERDRRTLDQLVARQAAAERRAAVLEGEDHELGERLAETEQARHRLQATRAEAEAAQARPSAGWRWPRRRCARPSRSTPGPRPGPTPWSGPSTRPGGRPAPSCWPGSTGSWAPSSTWSRWTPGGRRPSRPPPVRRWPPWSSRAASRPGRPVPPAPGGRHRSGAGPDRFGGRRARCWPDRPCPTGTESIRGHVRPRAGGRGYPGLDGVLDTLLHGSCCATGGWSEAIDLALARPDLVVVTHDGDRFSPTGWRVRAGGGVVTAAVVDEARDAGRGGPGRGRPGHGGTDGRPGPRSRRPARPRPRPCGPTTATRWPTRPPGWVASGCRATGTCSPRSSRRSVATGPSSRNASGGTPPGWPSWWPVCRPSRTSGCAAAERVAAAREERRRDRGAPGRGGGGPHRVGGAHRRDWSSGAGCWPSVCQEVERRLTGHAEERQQAAERRRRLESDATAVERLSGVVAEAQTGLDSLLSALRDRHRRQLEAVRAGGARLEELRRQRSVNEHELAATRSRLQKAELDLVEATVRRESVVETLRRELGCGPEDALGAPRPSCPRESTRSTRADQLEAELAAIGPVNPLAMEELSELGERHQFLESQVEDVRKAQRELRQVIRTLDEEIMHVFDSAFADVNEHFSNLITSLFPGGTGRLSLTDPENLLTRSPRACCLETPASFTRASWRCRRPPSPSP